MQKGYTLLPFFAVKSLKLTVNSGFLLLAFNCSLLTLQAQIDGNSVQSSLLKPFSDEKQTHQRFFLSFAFSITPDIEQSPYNISPNYVAETNFSNLNGPTITITRNGNEGMRQITTNFESVGLKLRLNLFEFSAISSLSLSANPTAGLGYSLLEQTPQTTGGGITGYISMNIPLFLEYSYGAGATHSHNLPYSTDVMHSVSAFKDRMRIDENGIFAFAGAEYTQSPLFHNNIPAELMMDANGKSYYMSLANNWIEPAAGLGVRYKSKKNKMREIFIKYGMGATDLFIGPSGYYPFSGHPWTLKLTFDREIL